MSQLEEAYGAETIARVRKIHDPQRVHEWLNHLSRDRVPKEEDVIYQLAKLTRFEFLDHPKGEGLYRKQMGFSIEEVASLPDESIETWVKNNRIEPENQDDVFYDDDVSDYLAKVSNAEIGWILSYAPWDRDSMPLADRFCREKQSLILRIRSLIQTCESGTFPEFEHGFFLHDDVPRFAADMLFVDARQAISESDLQRALDNLALISKLARIQFPVSNWSYFRQRIGARVMELLIHLAEVKQLDEPAVARIRKLAFDLNSPTRQSWVSTARNFASRMLEERSRMDSKNEENYLLFERKLESRLIAAFPQTVHWPSYIGARKKRFDELSTLRDDVLTSPSKLASIYEFATTDPDLEQPFHRHILDLFENPKARARRLGSIDYEYELIDLKLHVVYSIRAKLRSVALELLLYRAANGKFPPSLAELGCDVEDPFSNQDLIYRINDDRFDLYSVGADEVDGNGEQWNSDDFLFVWPARTLAEYFENN